MARKMPDKFGKCKVLRRIGFGATAVVYLARHEGLDMPVAVKVLRGELLASRPDYAERFLREARMAAWLQHPNLVRVIDCGVEGGYHYMVMDYVDGPNCRQQLKDHPQGLDWSEGAEIVRQAANGLAYASDRDVIHRDVKPSNIMIESSGRVRVTDLGLAKLSTKGMVELTRELHTVGTPNYMSPEQIQSSSDLDVRADIYSLGATFYHLATGKPPFKGDTAMEVIAQHLSAPLVPPSEKNPAVSPAISSIICKMMAKSREERYQDYEELSHDLYNVLEGKKTTAAGFRGRSTAIEDDEELRRVLEDLSFGATLKVETEEESGAVRGEASFEAEGDRSTTELDLFRPDEVAAYIAHEHEAARRPVPAKTPKKGPQRNVGLIVALIVGAVVVIALAVILLLLAIH